MRVQQGEIIHHHLLVPAACATLSSHEPGVANDKADDLVNIYHILRGTSPTTKQCPLPPPPPPLPPSPRTHVRFYGFSVR